MRKGKPKSPPEENQGVKLKPLWGMQPTHYIGLFYGIGFGLILFFLLIFPGLYHGGSQVTIHTVPEGASVYIDNVRLGSSPLTTFLKAGSHTLQIRKVGFFPVTQTIAVERRIVGSLFFPRKMEVRVPLKLTSSDILFSGAYDELTSWVLAESPTSIRPYPPILRNLASDLTRSSKDYPVPPETWNKFFLQCLPQINSEGVFKDFLGALSLVQSNGKVLTHRSFLEVLKFFAALLNDQPNTLYWFSFVLPPSSSSTLKNHPVIARRLEDISRERKSRSLPPPMPAGKPSPIRIGGMEFIPIPEGAYHKGWAMKAESGAFAESLFMPYPVRISPFFLLSTEVTEEQFSTFLQETPAWAPSARETLKKQGLVDDGYLSSWNNSSEPPHPSLPVREISYFAAKAFCQWLQTKYPAYRFDLPSEEEWEWAATLNTDSTPFFFPSELKPVHLGDKGRWGLRFMLGNVWEWTDTWFAPLQDLFPEVSLKRGAEKIVKGGSYINSPDTITVSTRGSQPPTWCTPYLGFRIKAIPK